MLKILIAAFLISSPVFAKDCRSQLEKLFQTQLDSKNGKSLKLAPGRHVYYEYFKASTGKPTLIFLPGMNRAIPDSYKVIQSLRKQGYGILISATSVHWQSLNTLKAETPYFFNQGTVTLKSLAKEVEVLVDHLKIKNPISISLSMSSTLASFLPYPIIQSAPLVRITEMDPSSYEMAAAWENTIRATNPFFAEQIIRQTRDMSYYNYWTKEVATNLLMEPSFYNFVFPSVIVKGYMEISKASENFDLYKTDFSKKESRRFILAGRESQVRLKNQLETFLKALKKGPSELIIIRDAEHNIIDSQPKAYELALKTFLDSKTDKTRVGVINPKSRRNEVQWLSAEEVKKLFAYILSFPDSTSESEL